MKHNGIFILNSIKEPEINNHPLLGRFFIPIPLCSQPLKSTLFRYIRDEMITALDFAGMGVVLKEYRVTRLR